MGKKKSLCSFLSKQRKCERIGKWNHLAEKRAKITFTLVFQYILQPECPSFLSADFRRSKVKTGNGFTKKKLSSMRSSNICQFAPHLEDSDNDKDSSSCRSARAFISACSPINCLGKLLSLLGLEIDSDFSCKTDASWALLQSKP